MTRPEELKEAYKELKALYTIVPEAAGVTLDAIKEGRLISDFRGYKWLVEKKYEGCFMGLAAQVKANLTGLDFEDALFGIKNDLREFSEIQEGWMKVEDISTLNSHQTPNTSDALRKISAWLVGYIKKQELNKVAE